MPAAGRAAPLPDHSLQPVGGDAALQKEAKDDVGLKAHDAVAQQEAVDLSGGAHDLRSRLLPATRKPAMVDVCVRDHDAANVVRFETRCVQLGDERLPGAVVVRAGID